MTKYEAIEKIVREIDYRSKKKVSDNVREFLLGNTNFIDFSDYPFNSFNSYEFEYFECFDENGDFIENESGEILAKYIKYIYENYPEKLINLLIKIKEKYSLYKYLNFDLKFVKKDFLSLEFLEIYYDSYRNDVNIAVVKNFMKNYPEITDEIINNYKDYTVNTAILLSKKVLLENKKEDIEKLENILNGMIKSEIGDKNLEQIFKRYDKNEEFEKYFNNLEKINIREGKKENFIYLIKILYKYLENKSPKIFEGIKLILKIYFDKIMKYRYYGKNYDIETVNELEIFLQMYNFSKNDTICFLIDGMLKGDIIKNFDKKDFYKFLEKNIVENGEISKKILENFIEVEEINSAIILNILIKQNLITKEEKEKYIKSFEKILLKVRNDRNVFKTYGYAISICSLAQYSNIFDEELKKNLKVEHNLYSIMPIMESIKFDKENIYEYFYNAGIEMNLLLKDFLEKK